MGKSPSNPGRSFPLERREPERSHHLAELAPPGWGHPHPFIFFFPSPHPKTSHHEADISAENGAPRQYFASNKPHNPQKRRPLSPVGRTLSWDTEKGTSGRDIVFAGTRLVQFSWEKFPRALGSP